MDALRQRFSQPIGERLGDNGRVIVVLRLELGHQRIEAVAGGHGEGAEVVVRWGDQIGQREVGAS